jgi:hypothetical protein
MLPHYQNLPIADLCRSEVAPVERRAQNWLSLRLSGVRILGQSTITGYDVVVVLVVVEGLP